MALPFWKRRCWLFLYSSCFLIGVVEVVLGSTTEAVHDIAVASANEQQEEESLEAVLQNAQQLAASGYDDLAMLQYERVQERIGGGGGTHKNGQTCFGIAGIHARRKNYTAALVSYQDAAKWLDQELEFADWADAHVWIGVSYRRTGNTKKGMDWINKAIKVCEDRGWNEDLVRWEAVTRVKRNAYHHLAMSYTMEAQFVPATKNLVTAMNIEAKNEDFELLSTLLSAMDMWHLLADAWGRCFNDMCKNDASYRMFCEYALALDYSGNKKMALEVMAQAEQLKLTSGNKKNKTQVIQDVAMFAETSKRNRQAANDIPNDQGQREKVLWPKIKAMLKPFLLQRKIPAWKRIRDRHITGFQWPIPLDLVLEARQEIFHQSFGSDQHGELIPCLTCLHTSFFTLDECVSIGRVHTHNTVVQLENFLNRTTVRDNNVQVAIQTYADNDAWEEYPALRDDDDDKSVLKIGLFSANIHLHPMLPLVHAFLKYASALPNVQVTLYYEETTAQNNMLQLFAPYVKEQVPCTSTTFIRCVFHARHAKIQVWLDTTGASAGTGLAQMSAMGAAPVGVLWAGFPSSMAMPSTLQYIVMDRYSLPLHHMHKYTEEPIYVPGSWMIAEPPYGRDDVHRNATIRKELREKFNIPVNAVVYSYFGRLFKISDEVFYAWQAILRRVPNSYLVLTQIVQDSAENTAQSLINEWVRSSGLARDRLVFVPVMARGVHFTVMSQMCDVALDTNMVSGGTTAYEALYAHLPLVHYTIGEKMMQRAGGSILVAAGLDAELLATDWESYVAIAARLGLDKPYYQKIVAQLHNAFVGQKEDAVLFQPEIGVKAMVEGMREAYRKWKDGQTPAPIFSDAEWYQSRQRSKTMKYELWKQL